MKFFLPILVLTLVVLTGCQSKTQSENAPGLGYDLELPQKQSASNYKNIYSKDLLQVSDVFDFSVEIPDTWQVEAVPEVEAINIYNPNTVGENNLEKSQIFIRYFKASSFLTLSTVNIFSQESAEVINRPAVIYDIEKKSGIADFVNQPSWRNGRHTVTDMRTSDESPTIFYVIAKRPDLNHVAFDKFLNSIELNPEKKINNTSSLVEPIAELKKRITKKSFGVYIDPENSPVSPEKFTGYHTGIDVEYDDTSQGFDKKEITVYAIADGKVIFSNRASGYGGVVAIEHEINDSKHVVVYGHLDPLSMIKNNSEVKAGQKIAILGDGNTAETDGERKHLHLAILQSGLPLNLAGYVKSQQELKGWIDPMLLFD